MKGRIEAISPQRQFENIKFVYKFNTAEEKEEAVKQVIEDLNKYHHITGKMVAREASMDSYKKELGIVDEWGHEGTDYRKRTVGSETFVEKYLADERQWVKL